MNGGAMFSVEKKLIFIYYLDEFVALSDVNSVVILRNACWYKILYNFKNILFWYNLYN
jgi:hypothetical protein